MIARALGVAVGILLVGTSACWGSIRYTVQDLGSLGVWSVSPGALNELGWVAGYASPTGSTVRAFLWRDAGMEALGTLGGSSSYGYGLNDAGWVTGVSYNHAFLWDGSEMKDLGTVPGGSSSSGFAINSVGKVAGYSYTSSTTQHAVLWDGANVQDLGVPLGWRSSMALGINDSDQIVGWGVSGYDSTGAVGRAWLWDGGAFTELGTLGGTQSSASAINKRGQVVGASTPTGQTNSEYGHAFLWDSGVMTDLGTLGGQSSRARGVNDSGWVVGHSRTGSDVNVHAFVWDGTLMQDLNGLIDPASGWKLTSAADINNKGQITGYGEWNGQGGHAFLLTPVVPELPPTLLAAVLPLMGLCLRRFRRR